MKEIITGESVKEVWITEFAYDEFPSLVENNLYNSNKDSTIPESNMSSPNTGEKYKRRNISSKTKMKSSSYVVACNREI